MSTVDRDFFFDDGRGAQKFFRFLFGNSGRRCSARLLTPNRKRKNFWAPRVVLRT